MISNTARSRINSVLSLATLTFLIAGGVLYAGPLNPPAGPITSTYKTLTEIEPRIAINAANTPGDSDASPSLFKITQPGSYYLTGNITLVNARSAIEITASGVVLDLNGYSITGFAGQTGIIVTNPSIDRVAIRNGHIINFLSGGIDANVAQVEIARVNVRSCGVLGIRTGARARIADCTVADCSSNAIGINVGNQSIVDRCIASGNAGKGINVLDACVVSNCTASSNGAEGIYAIGQGCTITGCAMNGNATRGLWAFFGGCRISNCSATLNGTVGIGIAAVDGGTIADCTTSLNGLDGIVCNAKCVVRGNSCSNDGTQGTGAGIRVLNADNRIEGNNCTGASRGIDVDFAGNIIIRNTCSGNTINWEIAIGNSVGAIVVAGTNAAAISGNGPVASTLGSTDPNANLSY